MNKVSYSQFSKWKNCPYAWKLKYVDGHRLDNGSMHTLFGSAIHETIQEWLDILYNKNENMAKTIYLHDMFKDKLIEGFRNSIVEDGGEKTYVCTKKELMEFFDQGCEILTYVQNHQRTLFPTSNLELFGVEIPIEIEIRPGVVYTGYIDIVTVNKVTKKYTLYDLKTSTRGWNEYQKKDPVKTGQLLLYKKFFSAQYGIPEESISVEFMILKRIIGEGSMFQIPRVSRFEPANKKPSMNKTSIMFEEFVNGCFNTSGEYREEQVATPSKQACRWCEFKDRRDLCSYGAN